MRTAFTIVGVAIIMGFILIPKSRPIAKVPLPESGRGAAELLPPALAAAAEKHGVKVRASLFSSNLEEMYGYNLEGVPAIMAQIARSKARSCFAGTELKSPSMVETAFVYMLPWALGLTDEIPVMGSVKLQLPGLDDEACFVVNGAPSAAVDLAIAEESLRECGFDKEPSSGVWVMSFIGGNDGEGSEPYDDWSS